MRGRDVFARGAALVAGVVSLFVGLWAFFGPHSFYRIVATFPPYNRHFVHDLGSFQIGLGVGLLLALWWTDALFVVLWGFGVAAAFHFASHAIDVDLGGHPALDLFGLGILAVASLGAAAGRATARPGRTEATGAPPDRA